MKEENIVVTAFWGNAGRAVAPAGHASPDSHVIKENIVVKSLSASHWRVSDRRCSEYDAHGLLGYIEKMEDDVFEVMQLDHGFEWYSYASLAAATAHFANVQPSATPNNENMLSRLRAHT